MTRIDITPLEDAAEAMRQAQAEITRLQEENAKLDEKVTAFVKVVMDQSTVIYDLKNENAMISEVNAEQARRLGLYLQQFRQMMAQE